jgi:DNA-directed RNA polymerase specialized sigma24 family protein
MEKQIGRPSSLRQRAATLEKFFQELPPLGSDDYLAHVEGAPTDELPPEVLVRAFRQLPPDSLSSRVTLRRLVGRRPDGSWEYLGPLITYARKVHQKDSPDSYEDLLQDAAERMMRTLPTSRGAFAERSWNSFCRRELIDAWRDRYGRRGEHLPREESLEVPDEDGPTDRLTWLTEPPVWHVGLMTTRVETIEKIAIKVLQEIPDEFVRSVAQRAWFNNQPPAVSGAGTAEGGASLTSLFPQKSRSQIMRALRHAKAQLAAALLKDHDLVLGPDLDALLLRLSGRTMGASSALKEMKK